MFQSSVIESTPLTESPLLEASHISPASDSKIQKRWIAVLLSSIFPGTGHFLLRRKRLGFIFLASFLLLVCLYWPVRTPVRYVSLILTILGSFVIFLAAGWSALFGRSAVSARPSRWYLALAIPAALVGVTVFNTLALRAAGFGRYEIPATSMETTIVAGDNLIADQRYYRSRTPQPFEIVIFKRNNTLLVKRIVAMGGSTIEGRNGIVIVDGHVLDEPYVQHLGPSRGDLNNFGPVAVPNGKLFVLGDNRDVSFDSRQPEFGLVDLRAVVAKPLYIIRPKSSRVGMRLP